MSEPIFFKRSGGLTIGEIVALTKAHPRPDLPLDRLITDLAALDRAGPSDVAFVDQPRLSHQLATTRAGLCLTTEALAGKAPQGLAVLCSDEPYRAFLAVAMRLYPDAARPSSLFEGEGIAPLATVHASARLENGVTVDAGAVIGPRAEIGAGTLVATGAVIGPDVRIGRDCSIGVGSVVTHAFLGDRVVLHPGCRIGQDGYAFARGARGHQKIVQVGRVIIQDDVEIGANTAVDRGGIQDTVIGEGTKIDNLVQIGHNVQVGRHCLLMSQVGLSGSIVVEDHAVLEIQVGIADHVNIGEDARLLAKSGVPSDIPGGQSWGGSPAMPEAEWLESQDWLRRMIRRDGGRATGGSAQEEP
jgi:UDP-3-O-[3-hydroxymyristoyl] glucosamine N-acyltransferase